MPLVSMSDKRLGGIANSSLSNFCAICALADSTSRILYPSASLSARSLWPPLARTCLQGPPAGILASAEAPSFRFDTVNLQLRSNFPDFGTRTPTPLQQLLYGPNQEEIRGPRTRTAARHAEFGFRNSKSGRFRRPRPMLEQDSFLGRVPCKGSRGQDSNVRKRDMHQKSLWKRFRIPL